MTKDEQIEILEHYIRNYDDRIEELGSEISDLKDEKQVLVTIGEELQEQLDECESLTFGMPISQISCYETFMEILERLPVGAHEIEEKLLELYGK